MASIAPDAIAPIAGAPDAILAAVPTALEHPAIQRVLDVAARKGVTLEVTAFPETTHTAADAARVVSAEIGQIVKSLVFVVAGDDGRLEPIVCLVSGADRVDLERLAAVVGPAGRPPRERP